MMLSYVGLWGCVESRERVCLSEFQKSNKSEYGL